MYNSTNHSNMVATARRRALAKTNTYQAVKPLAQPQGYLLTTYTATRWPCGGAGRGIVVARLLNPQGQLVAYRCRYNGATYTMPAGNLAAIGTLFVPNAIAHKLGYMG